MYTLYRFQMYSSYRIQMYTFTIASLACAKVVLIF